MKPRFDVVLLTESRYLAPQECTPYVLNVLKEDELVQSALEKLGLRTTRINWADKNFDWTSTRAALFRTTWNYFNYFSEFTQWLNVVSGKTRLINAVELIQWNMDKHYLRDLEAKGISIPPTVFIEPQEQMTLKKLQAQTGWKEFILKPAVAGGARHTYRLREDTLQEYEQEFQTLLRSEAMLIQPFLNNVLTQGEYSFIVINGKYTHAVLKIATQGDFRVQDDHGGTVQSYEATDLEKQFAENVAASCASLPLYARVDVINDNEGKPTVTELEIIEPELWFRFYPEAATALAEAVKEVL